jgi:hypothetical protein
MKFKVGDKVNFLNETGGGVIKAVIDSKMVRIETEDGFEMPVMVTELIKDFRAEERAVEMYPTAPTVSQQSPQPEQEPEEDRVTLINPWGKAKEESGIFLAYEPHDRQWVLTGLLDVFLINHTSHDLMYNLFLIQDDVLRGIDFSLVPGHSKILIDTIDRDEIENWTRGYIQVMFHGDTPDRVFFPLHSVIDIKVNRFFKEGSYKSSGLLQGRSVLVSIAPAGSFEVASFDESSRKFEIGSKAEMAGPVKEKPFIDRYKTEFGVAIVDLHIGEVIDNISGLSSHDMLNIQVNHFKKALESALNSDYHKVTFIHGVGNGVLKNAIVEELEAYESVESKIASISKFGVGAVDVVIKQEEL